MNYYIPKDKLPGNLCSIGVGGTQDGHGGHAAEHHEEMQQIALDTVEKVVPSMVQQYCEQVWTAAIAALHNVLSADITSRVEIGVTGCADVFYGSKAQKFISDSVVKAMEQAIGGIKLHKMK